jgi:hypothetical protein
MSNPEEVFRRLVRRAQGTGGGPRGNVPNGAFAGAGLVVALVVGGLVLNESLFNG